MLPLRLDLPDGAPLRLLCLGAHCDDVEIGAGGTVRRLAAERPLLVRWEVLTSTPERAEEARASAAWFAAEARELTVEVGEWPASFLPAHWEAVKRHVGTVARDFAPDLVLSHRRADEHQDHRMLGEIAWQACRDTLILEYEIAKWEGDLGQPNLYVPLSEAAAREKAEAVERFFPSQAELQWFDAETFLGLMRLRGLECSSPTRYAEAFHAPKLTL